MSLRLYRGAAFFLSGRAECLPGRVNLMTMQNQALNVTPLPAVAAGQPGSDLSVGAVRRSILPGGIRVITEKISGTCSVSIGMWVPRGSRDESEDALGSTHFLEHLLFKGTSHRTARDIAMTFDRIGGDSNASTGKELTRFYADVLAEDIPIAIDCLLDMVTCCNLSREDFERERTVIINELTMALDNASEQAKKELLQRIFPNHPLGRPIGGNISDIKAATLEAIHHHYRSGYTPDQLVVAAAGAVNHEQICELVQQNLQGVDSQWEQWTQIDFTAPARDFAAQISCPMTKHEPQAGVYRVQGDFQQTHVLLGRPGIAVNDEHEYVQDVYKTILGQGMSSRLFQRIREERGLAYYTFAFEMNYRDAGMIGVAAVCAPDKADEVTRHLREEVEELGSKPVTAEELTNTIGMLKGSYLMSLEDNRTRMFRLGNAEVVRGRFTPVEFYIQKIQAVSPADILRLGESIASRPVVEVRLDSAAR